jgi:O-antigen ligase
MRAASARTMTGGYRHTGLLWTDYWYLLATLAATIVAVDPLEIALASEAVFKHAALALSLPAIALTLAAAGVSTRRRAEMPLSSVVVLLWPLLALAAFALCGSVYARLIGGLQNSFLNIGLYMLTTVSAAIMVVRSEAPVSLVRGHLRILVVAALVMGVYLIANYRVRQVYHEQIFVVIPMAILFFAWRGPALVRWAGCLFFLAMAWLSAKYTSYLIGAMTVGYLALFVAVPGAARDGLRRTMLVYWTFALGAAFALVFIVLGMSGAFDLPTGNVEYRSHTYFAAWERFIASPLWGTLFAVEAVEKFTLYSVGVSRNLLATHSDVLDLLANGGLLGVVLWLWALWRVTRVAWANLLRPDFLEEEWAPLAHTLAVMSIAGAITYTFNPILLQPALAYLVWTNLGLLAGLALRMAAAGERVEDGHRATGARARPLQGRYGVAAAGLNARWRA